MSLMKKIEKNRLIPLFYHDDIKVCEEVLNVINRCNLPVLEFTNRGSNAVDNFNRLINSSENSEIYLGAGSIKSDNEAKVFIDLGASFIVSPFFDKGIALICKKNDIPYIPGCGSLTEMITAEKHGAKLLKLFPGGVYGPKFISSVLSPCPWLKIMPTGGVTAEIENISQWFNSGAFCIGMGSKLISKQFILDNNFGALKNHILNVIEIINNVCEVN